MRRNNISSNLTLTAVYIVSVKTHRKMIIDHPLILELHGCRRQIRKHYAFVWVSGDRAPDFSQNSRNRKQILEQSDECTWVGSGKQKTTASTGWGTISSASASRLYTSWNSATSSGTPSDHMSWLNTSGLDSSGGHLSPGETGTGGAAAEGTAAMGDSPGKPRRRRPGNLGPVLQ